MKQVKALLICFILVLFDTHVNAQQGDTKSATSFIGKWKGVSICQQKNSPCHDETVVYTISKMLDNDTIFIQASKIVNGEEQDMGILQCLFDENANKLVSVEGHGNWTFMLKENVIYGELIYQEHLYRKVRITKIL
ncbi:MAG TPA: hypothetical protein VFW78_05135 [Bacteroidia bacterium]|nr:hypothetical protein [Bacteroidia bacterium]